MTLTQKDQKYQHYYRVKFINMNILEAKKYCLFYQNRMKEQVKCTYSSSEESLEKQTKKNEISSKKISSGLKRFKAG